jgi:hypothetical protein
VTIARDDLLSIAIDAMPNETVIEQVRPMHAGYACSAVLLTGGGRIVNFRSGSSKRRKDAEDLAEGTGTWLGMRPFAFELGPCCKNSGGPGQ